MIPGTVSLRSDSGNFGGVSWYADVMTRDQVKAILERVLSWPEGRQADVAHVVELMEAGDHNPLQLGEEDAAEVRRRPANPREAAVPA